MPRLEEVDEEGGPSYPVITGQYDGAARWASVPLRPGTPLAAPQPLFTKLDPSVADEELARLEA
jgi:methionyl-tRNA synthetase